MHKHIYRIGSHIYSQAGVEDLDWGIKVCVYDIYIYSMQSGIYTCIYAQTHIQDWVPYIFAGRG